MALTDAQKKASKKYRAKVKPIQFAVQYKTTDKPDGERLKAYLAATGQTANAYIKALIRRDLDAQGIPYPANNPLSADKDSVGDNSDTLPMDKSGATDRLPWESDDNTAHSSGSAWDVLEQIARENGYKG